MMPIPKPAYGSPCNGCGKCCEIELCPLAAALYRTWKGPCPALTPASEGSMTCGLVTMPGHYWPQKARRWGERELSRTALIIIGSGLGCDYLTETEGEEDRAMRKRMLDAAKKLAGDRNRCIQVWGIRDRLR
jgi:hypothetical protein